MRVLVVNAGSSSLKLRVLDEADQVSGAADLPARGGTADAAAIQSALASLGDADAAGYRIVHGGTWFTAPVRIDKAVLARLRTLTDLAPLHQPKSLAAVAAVQRALPGLPGVACFDTAFHATIPAAAATYALPREWRQRWALRRYGFHGLSHAYCSRRAAQLAGPAGATGRIVTCHLGAGAAQAVVEGLIVADFESDKYRTEKKDREIQSVKLAGFDAGLGANLTAAIDQGRAVAESQNFARDLINEPSNRLTPRMLATRAEAMAKEVGLGVEILD